MDKDALEKRKAELSPEAYRVTQKKATEPAFTGEYLNNKEKGVYKCTVCGEPLFDSGTKYDSGTGWPSFTKPVGAAVNENEDTSHGMNRTEVVCKHCGAHLGHVFPDGPSKEESEDGTGMRYCINSCALSFDPEEK